MFVRALCAAFLLLITACERSNELETPPPPEVTVTQPLEKPLTEYVETTGTTEAVDAVELRARVSGYLQQIAFQDGARMHAGDLLFVIDKAPFEAALASSEAALERARATLKLAELEAARAERLLKTNAIAKEEAERRQADLATSRAEVRSAEAALTNAQLELSYTEIRAPFDGEIGRHLVDIGALVQAEQTLLASYQRRQPIHAYFYLNELEFLRLQEEMKALGSEQVELRLSTMEEDRYSHVGTLDFQAPRVDSGTGTVQWRGIFPNEKLELVPGLFVRIRAAIGRPEPKLLILEKAVATDQIGDYLLVVREDGTVERRSIRLGELREGYRIIREGLQGNESVIVEGLQRARPGAKVHARLSQDKPATASTQPSEGEHPDSGAV